LLSSSVSRYIGKRLDPTLRGLAAMLAAAVLLFSLLATNSGFHEALHHGDKAASNNCVLCLFAKGQVDQPLATPVVAAFAPAIFLSAPQVESVVLVDFSYLSSPSRAPPALASLLLAVA